MAPHSRTSKATSNQPCLVLIDFGVFFASLGAWRNTVFVLTTKRTPSAPREGLFLSRKQSTGLVSVKTGLLFLIENPATPVLRAPPYLEATSKVNSVIMHQTLSEDLLQV